MVQVVEILPLGRPTAIIFPSNSMGLYLVLFIFELIYRKVSNIRRTKSQNLNASRLIL